MTRRTEAGQRGYIRTLVKTPGGWKPLSARKNEKPPKGADVRYQACYRDPEGALKTKLFGKKGEASAHIAANVHDVNTGQWRDPNAGLEPLGPYFDSVINAAEQRGDLRPTTCELYRWVGRAHVNPRFGKTPLQAISSAEIRAWTGKLLETQGRRTVEVARQSLSRVLRQAVQDDLIIRNPATGTALRKQPTKPLEEARIMGAQDVLRIADAVSERDEGRYRALVLLLGFCGLRIGEAAGLAEGDLNLLKGTLTVRNAVVELRGLAIFGPPKTSQSVRTIILPAIIREALDNHISEHPPHAAEIATAAGDMTTVPFIFSSAKGGVLRRSTFRSRVWVRSLESLEMGEYVVDKRGKHFKPAFRIHDLRHAAASFAIDSGATVHAVQKMLGHSSPTITLERYTHLFASRDETLADHLDGAIRAEQTAISLQRGGFGGSSAKSG